MKTLAIRVNDLGGGAPEIYLILLEDDDLERFKILFGRSSTEPVENYMRPTHNKMFYGDIVYTKYGLGDRLAYHVGFQVNDTLRRTSNALDDITGALGARVVDIPKTIYKNICDFNSSIYFYIDPQGKTIQFEFPIIPFQEQDERLSFLSYECQEIKWVDFLYLLGNDSINLLEWMSAFENSLHS